MPISDPVVFIIQGVFAIISCVFGFLAKELYRMIKDTQKELADHKECVALNYIPRSDYRQDIQRVFDMLDKINDKLDNKADRDRGGT